MSSSKSLDESRTRFVASFPEFVVYFFITALVWIFGMAVFIPLSSLVHSTPSIAPIITLIFLGAISYSGAKLLYSGKRALDSFLDISSHWQKRKHLRPNSTRFAGYVGLAILGGLIFAPLTWLINPVFGGITIALVVITIMFLVLPLVSDALVYVKRAPSTKSD